MPGAAKQRLLCALARMCSVSLRVFLSPTFLKTAETSAGLNHFGTIGTPPVYPRDPMSFFSIRHKYLLSPDIMWPIESSGKNNLNLGFDLAAGF